MTPPGLDWSTWLILAGRGWGKTRTGAEDVAWYGVANAGTRIAVIGPTYADARDTCVEGESGLLGVLPPEMVATWNRSLGELILVNGTRYKLFSADEPDRLRGPQHHRAWCFIAGTMVATPDGEQPIEMLQAGQFVLTRKGPRRVLTTRNRAAVVGQLSFEGERDIVGTPDHPVYTSRGWTRLDSLRIGDIGCALDASSGATSSGIATARVEAATTSARTNWFGLSEPFAFIAKFGSRLMAMCQRATKSITAMKTRPITRLAIWNASARIGIPRNTAQLLQSLDATGRQSLMPSWSAPIAVAALSESSARQSWFADRASLEGLSKSGRCGSSASNAASPLLAEPATSAASVASTWQPLGEREVFCLTVEGEPEFFANGILVHNCDELAAWTKPDTWDQMLFGLRLGDHPQVVVTTTPKPTPLVRRIAKDARTRLTKGRTLDNAANLAPSALEQLQARYAGTRLGRQELEAELLDDVPGALWTRAMVDEALKPVPLPDMARVVVAIDPSGTRGTADSGDDIGIVVAGLGVDGRGYVLADRSCKLSPAGWGRRAVEAYHEFSADRIVAERNFGGAMVESVIRTADANASYAEVTASRGKAIRAEPVAALYEQGRVSHLPGLSALEDQMCHMASDGYLGEGSPDRLDAGVWALTDLMLGETDYDPAMWARLLD